MRQHLVERELTNEGPNPNRPRRGGRGVTVNLVWSPPWTPDRIEPRVRAYLGF